VGQPKSGHKCRYRLEACLKPCVVAGHTVFITILNIRLCSGGIVVTCWIEGSVSHQAPLCGNLGQAVHTCMSLSLSSII